MTSTILLTGGTGTLGRLIAPMLLEAGVKVRVLTRHSKPSGGDIEFVTGDLATGEGVETAVDGVDTILHCAGSAKGDEEKARTLVRAAAKVGNPHLVYISVVGADAVPIVSRIDRAIYGYFAAKLGAERVVAASGLPWTTLRATQFHDWILMTLEAMAKLPVMPLWGGAKFQPVEAEEVAARLVELALGEPAGLVPDIAGPRVYTMEELAKSYLRASGKHRLMWSLRTPGKAAAAFRAGANLAPDHAVGSRSWEDFLSKHYR